jgi:hypothetical protein
MNTAALVEEIEARVEGMPVRDAQTLRALRPSSRQIGQPGPYPPNDPECLAEKPRLVYVVFYDFDPSLSRGFVYLPGRAEAFYFLNIGTIARGCEGHWFLAKDSWEAFMRPLITQALRQNH